MKIHEFQSKKILEEHNLTIPRNHFFKEGELFDYSKIPFSFPVVLKSQVLAGGRGKANLVQLLDDTSKFEEMCNWIINQEFKGERSVGILVEESINIEQEYYFCMLIDRASKSLTAIFSPFGGVDIEKVASDNPESIITLQVSIKNEVFKRQLMDNTFCFFPNKKKLNKFIEFAVLIKQVFLSIDATLLEINPFVFDKEDTPICLDCVIDIDESAKFRHEELFAELENLSMNQLYFDGSNHFGSHYLELDGSIGIMGCGAGIVMASMDMIKKFNGTPANFLDLGGGATKEITLNALKLLNSNSKINCIFVNIFGGITFCDKIAEAIIEYRSTNINSLPMIIRMMGNNSDIAISMLKENGIFAYNSMERAARKAVEISQKHDSQFFVSRDSKVIVQGISGKYGSYHAKKMLEYGTKIVAGVTPGRGGETIHGVTIYNSVKEVTANTHVDATVLFVPAPHVKSATIEAIDAGVNLIVIITEHVPIHDTMEMVHYAYEKGARIIGPNCPGIIRVNEANLGIIPGKILKKGNVAIMSKSGTLLYEIANEISNNTKGVSTAIGLGGDPISGTSVIDTVTFLLNSKESDYIVYIGEIGGGEEEEKLANLIKSINKTKPLIAFFAGDSAPKGSKMGHAGAIINSEKSTVQYKKEILKNAGCMIAELPSDIYKIINQLENC